MTAKQASTKDPLKIRNYSFFIALVYTILLAFILLVNIRTIKKEALKRAYNYTQVGFDKDVLYRRWISEHGGVYVKIDSTTPPNPYLSHIPDRDIIIDSNLRLTLLNPAYMTRQVYELQEAFSEVRGHITSLKPLRGANTPDSWEIKALHSFENGATEFSGLDLLDGKEYFRFMKPFLTEESCLKCHAKDGYKLNDIRGGVSIAYPMSKVAMLNAAELRNQYILYFVLWILGIGGIVLSYFQLMKNAQKRFLAEKSLKELNQHLEEKIEQRSRELQKSQNDWENIFNTIDSPAQLIDKNHLIQYVNKSTLKAFNFKKEELIGEHCYKLFQKCSRAPKTCPLTKALAQKFPAKNEMLIEVNETSYIATCSPILDEKGELESVMHIMTDITSRKEIEQELIMANAIINRGPSVAFRWKNEPGWPIEFVSQNIEALTGHPIKDFILGKTAYANLIHPEDKAKVSEEVASYSASSTRQNFTHEPYRIITKDQKIKWVNEITFIWRNEEEKITHLEGIVTDITAQIESKQVIRKAHELLQLSEEKFRQAFETSPDSININRLSDGAYVNINSGFTQLTGFTKEETLGKTSKEINIWHDLNDRKRLVDELSNKGFVKNLEAKFSIKSGKVIDGLMSANIIHLNGEKHILSITRDITSFKNTQALLLKSEEKFRAAFETSVDSINITKIKDGIYVNVNKGFMDVTGYTAEETIGNSSLELNIWDNPNDRDKLIEAIKTKGYINNLEAKFRRKDGRIIYGLMSANTVEIDGEKHILSITRDITERKEAENELKLYRGKLEELVKARTKELAEKNQRLEEMNKVFVGRELRMTELKDEIEKLKNG
ncbi:MAG: PAS domain S-box protein [Bacteroidales bacterium]|nr:PAS domain S-box protein [Bacteroidales bacterium]